jgi:hypothetical protein
MEVVSIRESVSGPCLPLLLSLYVPLLEPSINVAYWGLKYVDRQLAKDTSTRKRLACAYCTPYNALLKAPNRIIHFSHPSTSNSVLHPTWQLVLIVPSSSLPRT